MPNRLPADRQGTSRPFETWLRRYDAPFNAKDFDKLGAFYHRTITIYEGGGINDGWIDYRDRHRGGHQQRDHAGHAEAIHDPPSLWGDSDV